jgi:rhomboid protease GluP
MQTEYPVNPIPPVAIALFVVIAGLEAVLSLAAAGMVGGPAGIGWRVAAIEDYGFSPAVWDQIMGAGDRSFDMLKRFVTYPFVHGSFTQALFGAALILALGKFVGEKFHPLAVLVLFFASAIAGAVAFGIFVNQNTPLFGAFPPIYGFIGAYSYVLWLRLGQTGENQLRAFRMIGFLMALQLVFALLFGSQPFWIADIAGFVAGFALSVLLSPGGWAAFVGRVRSR